MLIVTTEPFGSSCCYDESTFRKSKEKVVLLEGISLRFPRMLCCVLTYESEPNCLAHFPFLLIKRTQSSEREQKGLSIARKVSRCSRAFCSDAKCNRRLEDARNHRQQKHAHRCRCEEEAERRKRLCSTKKGRIVNTWEEKRALWAWQHIHTFHSFVQSQVMGSEKVFPSYPQQRKGLVQFNLLH